MTRTRSASSSRADGARPYPRPREKRKPLSADPALDSIGAVYVGWGAGKRDPAPLCCPLQAKASLIKRFGHAAVGWLSVAPQIPQPKPAPAQPTSFSPSSSASQRLTALPLGALPPLPPLPPSLPKTSAATPLRSSSLSKSPALRSSASATSSSSSTHASFTGFNPMPYTTSTPPDYCSSSSSRDYSPPLLFEEACQSGFDDTTLALPLVESRPPSPKLAPTTVVNAQQPFGPFSLALSTVLEDLPVEGPADFVRVKREDDELSEALWSAGEDPLGNCAATDVVSEASWAW